MGRSLQARRSIHYDSNSSEEPRAQDLNSTRASFRLRGWHARIAQSLPSQSVAPLAALMAALITLGGNAMGQERSLKRDEFQHDQTVKNILGLVPIQTAQRGAQTVTPSAPITIPPQLLENLRIAHNEIRAQFGRVSLGTTGDPIGTFPIDISESTSRPIFFQYLIALREVGKAFPLTNTDPIRYFGISCPNDDLTSTESRNNAVRAFRGMLNQQVSASDQTPYTRFAFTWNDFRSISGDAEIPVGSDAQWRGSVGVALANLSHPPLTETFVLSRTPNTLNRDTASGAPITPAPSAQAPPNQVQAPPVQVQRPPTPLAIPQGTTQMIDRLRQALDSAQSNRVTQQDITNFNDLLNAIPREGNTREGTASITLVIQEFTTHINTLTTALQRRSAAIASATQRITSIEPPTAGSNTSFNPTVLRTENQQLNSLLDSLAQTYGEPAVADLRRRINPPTDLAGALATSPLHPNNYHPPAPVAAVTTVATSRGESTTTAAPAAQVQLSPLQLAQFRLAGLSGATDRAIIARLRTATNIPQAALDSFNADMDHYENLISIATSTPYSAPRARRGQTAGPSDPTGPTAIQKSTAARLATALRHNMLLALDHAIDTHRSGAQASFGTTRANAERLIAAAIAVSHRSHITIDANRNLIDPIWVAPHAPTATHGHPSPAVAPPVPTGGELTRRLLDTQWRQLNALLTSSSDQSRPIIIGLMGALVHATYLDETTAPTGTRENPAPGAGLRWTMYGHIRAAYEALHNNNQQDAAQELQAANNLYRSEQQLRSARMEILARRLEDTAQYVLPGIRRRVVNGHSTIVSPSNVVSPLLTTANLNLDPRSPSGIGLLPNPRISAEGIATRALTLAGNIRAVSGPPYSAPLMAAVDAEAMRLIEGVPVLVALEGSVLPGNSRNAQFYTAVRYAASVLVDSSLHVAFRARRRGSVHVSSGGTSATVSAPDVTGYLTFDASGHPTNLSLSLSPQALLPGNAILTRSAPQSVSSAQARRTAQSSDSAALRSFHYTGLHPDSVYGSHPEILSPSRALPFAFGRLFEFAINVPPPSQNALISGSLASGDRQQIVGLASLTAAAEGYATYHQRLPANAHQRYRQCLDFLTDALGRVGNSVPDALLTIARNLATAPAPSNSSELLASAERCYQAARGLIWYGTLAQAIALAESTHSGTNVANARVSLGFAATAFNQEFSSSRSGSYPEQAADFAMRGFELLFPALATFRQQFRRVSDDHFVSRPNDNGSLALSPRPQDQSGAYVIPIVASGTSVSAMPISTYIDSLVPAEARMHAIAQSSETMNYGGLLSFLNTNQQALTSAARTLDPSDFFVRRALLVREAERLGETTAGASDRNLAGLPLLSVVRRNLDGMVVAAVPAARRPAVFAREVPRLRALVDILAHDASSITQADFNARRAPIDAVITLYRSNEYAAARTSFHSGTGSNRTDGNAVLTNLITRLDAAARTRSDPIQSSSLQAALAGLSWSIDRTQNLPAELSPLPAGGVALTGSSGTVAQAGGAVPYALALRPLVLERGLQSGVDTSALVARAHGLSLGYGLNLSGTPQQVSGGATAQAEATNAILRDELGELVTGTSDGSLSSQLRRSVSIRGQNMHLFDLVSLNPTTNIPAPILSVLRDSISARLRSRNDLPANAPISDDLIIAEIRADLLTIRSAVVAYYQLTGQQLTNARDFFNGVAFVPNGLIQHFADNSSVDTLRVPVSLVDAIRMAGNSLERLSTIDDLEIRAIGSMLAAPAQPIQFNVSEPDYLSGQRARFRVNVTGTINAGEVASVHPVAFQNLGTPEHPEWCILDPNFIGQSNWNRPTHPFMVLEDVPIQGGGTADVIVPAVRIGGHFVPANPPTAENPLRLSDIHGYVHTIVRGSREVPEIDLTTPERAASFNAHFAEFTRYDLLVNNRREAVFVYPTFGETHISVFVQREYQERR